MKFDIFNGFSKKAHPYEQYSQQNVINLYIEVDEEGKNVKAFYLRPGLEKVAEIPQGSEIRNSIVDNDVIYFVNGDRLFLADEALSFTQLNSELPLSTVNGRVDLSINQNNQLFITDNAKGYIYDPSDSSFSEITDSEFPLNPVGSVYYYGYFLTGKSGTNEIYLNDINDGFTWNFEGEPIRFNLNYRKDEIQQIKVLSQEIYFFCKNVTEVWYNPGASGLIPFRRNTNKTFEYGTPAPSSVASSHGIICFIGQDSDGNASVMMTDGNNLQKISNIDLDEMLSKIKIDDAIGFIYKIDSQIFYNLTFPTESITYSYNIASKSWSKYESKKNERFIPNSHSYFFDAHLVGDYQSSSIFKMSRDNYKDDGALFRWSITTKNIFDENDYNRISIKRLILDMQKGRAKPNEVNPRIFLNISKDGGVSFSSKKVKTQTSIGNYTKRLIFYTLGISRDFVLNIEGYNALPQAIMGCSINMEKLNQ